MPFKINNKTAEKYDLDTTLKVIEQVEYHLRTFDIPLFKRALAGAGLQPHVWSYLKRKWKDNDTIMETMIRIEGEFEGVLIVGGLRRYYHAGIVMLIMRSKYGYNDKQKEKVGEEEDYILDEEETMLTTTPPQASAQEDEIDCLVLPVPAKEECLSNSEDLTLLATDSNHQAEVPLIDAQYFNRYLVVDQAASNGENNRSRSYEDLKHSELLSRYLH